MIDAVTGRFGLTRMPFGRDLPPGRLHRHADCAEAREYGPGRLALVL